MQSRSVRWKLVDALDPDYEDAAGKAAILHARARAMAPALTHAYTPAAVHRHCPGCVHTFPYGKMDPSAGVPPISTDKPNLLTEIDGSTVSRGTTVAAWGHEAHRFVCRLMLTYPYPSWSVFALTRECRARARSGTPNHPFGTVAG